MEPVDNIIEHPRAAEAQYREVARAIEQSQNASEEEIKAYRLAEEKRREVGFRLNAAYLEDGNMSATMARSAVGSFCKGALLGAGIVGMFLLVRRLGRDRDRQGNQRAA